MGLYDNIQGHSSGIIDTHVALPLDEMAKSTDILNQRYNETQGNLDALNGTMQTAQGMFKNDIAIMGNQKDQTNADIKRYMDAGDYEHLGRAVQLTARKFGNTYAQVSANTKGYQDYIQSVQDMTNSSKEHEYVDPEKARNAIAAARLEYGDGLVQDPTTGRLTHYFHGIVPGASYETQKEVLAGIQAMHPNDKAFTSTRMGDIAGGNETDAKRLADENIKWIQKGDSESLSKSRVYLASMEYLKNSDKLMGDLRETADLKYRARGRDANIAEYAPLYAQQEATRQAQTYLENHPRATEFDYKGAYNYGLKDAAAKYQAYASDPNFNPNAQLAQHQLSSKIGDINTGNADIMSHYKTMTANEIQGDIVRDPASSLNLNYASVSAGDGGVSDYEGVIGEVKSRSALVKSLTAKYDAAKGDATISDVGRATLKGQLDQATSSLNLATGVQKRIDDKADRGLTPNARRLRDNENLERIEHERQIKYDDDNGYFVADSDRPFKPTGGGNEALAYRNKVASEYLDKGTLTSDVFLFKAEKDNDKMSKYAKSIGALSGAKSYAATNGYTAGQDMKLADMNTDEDQYLGAKMFPDGQYRGLIRGHVKGKGSAAPTDNYYTVPLSQEVQAGILKEQNQSPETQSANQFIENIRSMNGTDVIHTAHGDARISANPANEGGGYNFHLMRGGYDPKNINESKDVVRRSDNLTRGQVKELIEHLHKLNAGKLDIDGNPTGK